MESVELMVRSKDDNQQAPEFMAVLGLLPPYTEEDVKQAYWSKVKKLHPDHGGSTYLAMQINRAKDMLIRRAERAQP